MKDLAKQKCFNHPRREAAARCPDCGRFYCRECVTEHNDRVLCAKCLAKRRRTLGKKTSPRGLIAGLIQGVMGLWMAWFFFYYLGRTLVALPHSFHEGNLW